jgi:glycosyltransferase involved in cell wall biosynthesis
MTHSLGIVIPCYNEADSLVELVNRLSNPELQCIEFVLVDNGSTDETLNILSDLNLPKNIDWIQIPFNKGYGYGILMGLKELHTDFLGWTHADLQTDPADLLLFIEHLNGSAEFLKGRRRGRSISDRFFTAGMSLSISLLFARLLRDINGQPTVLSRRLYESWKLPPNDFGLDLFSYVHALRSRAPVVRIDVDFGKRVYGRSSWNAGFISRLRFIGLTLALAIKLRLSYRA